jgi:hypothetical protein
MQMHILSSLDGFTTNKGKMGNTWMRRKTQQSLKIYSGSFWELEFNVGWIYWQSLNYQCKIETKRILKNEIKIQMLEMFKIQLEYNRKEDEIGWQIWTNLVWCKLLIDSLTS